MQKDLKRIQFQLSEDPLLSYILLIVWKQNLKEPLVYTFGYKN